MTSPSRVLLITLISFMFDHLIMPNGQRGAHYLHPRETDSKDKTTGQVEIVTYKKKKPEGWYELSNRQRQKKERHKAQQENYFQQSPQDGPDGCELAKKTKKINKTTVVEDFYVKF